MTKYDRIYSVNMKRLALLTLPTWLRRPVAAALIYAGVSALGRLLHELRVFRADTFYSLSHNSQVCKLRGVLNDAFDSEQRRITVSDGDVEGLRAVVVYRRDAGRWLQLRRRGDGATILNRKGYGGASGYDFVVTVPGELKTRDNDTRLRAIINHYKLASKRYAVNYI